MSFSKEFAVAVAAGETAICVTTDEHHDALLAMNKVCTSYKWQLRVWDRVNGVQRYPLVPSRSNKPASLDSPRIAAALQDFIKEGPPADDIARVLVIRNFQVTDERPETLIPLIQELTEDGKENSKHLVLMVTPSIELPSLLSPIFHMISHELPELDELVDILKQIVVSDNRKGQANDTELRAVAKTALGLNRMQAATAFALSLQRHGEVRAAAVWKHKVEVLNREKLLTIYEGPETFDQVGGLTGAKKLLVSLLTPDEADPDDPEVRAKGVVMLGAPGVGKSLTAKCLGNETKRLAVLGNVGRLMGGIVGETEARTRRFFQLLRRLAPCLVVLDEFAKQMPSPTSKTSDGGVSARLAGEFLAQMNDLKEDVFWVLAENDIAHIDRGFTRAGRIDAILYVGLPAQAQRAQIWQIYFRKFFPAQIKGKPYKRYVELDVAKLIQLFAASNAPPAAQRASLLAMALMCLSETGREEAYEHIKVSPQTPLLEDIKAAMVADEGWTPAEIADCVRLMRKLKLSLVEAADLVSHVAVGDKTRIEKIEDWCRTNGTIDAETGKLLANTDDQKDKVTRKEAGKEKRRRVIRETNPEDN